MTNTTKKQLAFALIIFVGVAVCAIDLFWKSPTTVATNELLKLLLRTDDAVAMEGELVERFHASTAQAQRIRLWIEENKPIRGLTLKKNGYGFSIAPDQASHYIAILGKKRNGHLAVNVVAEQPPRSILQIVADDLGNSSAAPAEGSAKP